MRPASSHSQYPPSSGGEHGGGVPPALVRVPGDLLGHGLRDELVEPAEDQLEVLRAFGHAGCARRDGDVADLPQPVDPLSHHLPDAFAGQTRPRVGEHVALGGGGGDAREADAVVVDRSREGRDGAPIVRPGEHEVVGRGLQGGGHDGTGTFDRPEPVLGVDGRVADQGAGEAEDQVVAGLVREQERPDGVEPRRRVVGTPDLHRAMLRAAEPDLD